MIYDADVHGLPTNAAEGAIYYGHVFEKIIAIAICFNVLALCLWSSPSLPALSIAYEVCNIFFIVVFTTEAGLKIGAYTFKGYLQSR